MLIDKIKNRASELGDFFSNESPYRSANKGWIAENIYLDLRSEKGKNTKELDQVAQVSFYWQPIIQILTTLLFVISLGVLMAFSPIYLMK